MNEQFIALLERYEVDSWLQTMPKYKQSMITTMYDNLGDYEKVAREWLCVKNNSIAPFGSEAPQTPTLERILDELELLLRGDEKYKNEITTLLADSNIIQYAVVASISEAIAGVVGTASVFIGPVIGILLFIVLKMGVNAWLKAREEKRNRSSGAQ